MENGKCSREGKSSCGGDFMQFDGAETPNLKGLPVKGTFYFQSDHVNSTDMLTNESGEPVSRVAYTPYGEKSGFTGEDVFNKKYTGQSDDGDTGLLYYNARYYDPVIGRFITADTVIPDPSYSQSYNRYMYVAGNPVNYNDPSGHFSVKRSLKRFVNNDLIWVSTTLTGLALFGPIGAAIGFGVSTLFKKNINRGLNDIGKLTKDVGHSMSNFYKNEVKPNLKQTWNNNAWVRYVTYAVIIVGAIVAGALIGGPALAGCVIIGACAGFFYGGLNHYDPEQMLKFAAIGAVAGLVAGMALLAVPIPGPFFGPSEFLGETLEFFGIGQGLALKITVGAAVVGDAALLVNPYDVKAIASGMKRLMDDKELCAHLSEQGLKQAKLFSWAQTAKVIFDIYYSLCKGDGYGEYDTRD
jgi:RHS repeat-associated protein